MSIRIRAAAPPPGHTVSDVIGFNTEVSHRGLRFHVQTEPVEDGGEARITTLVFLGGAIVHRVSTPCDLTPGHPEELEERVRRQHQAALVGVQRGEFVPGRPASH